uniref:Diacylglycerol kinase domain containing protein n=1 Tax=Haemonchus contortus TaxID=6289 RepID=W6NBG8_HAECO
MGAALCCRRPRRVQDESSTVTYAGNRGTQSPAIGRVLVFVNPKSGSGKSLVTLRDRVEPKLKKNHIDYDVVITSGPNHAKSAIRSRDDLGEYNGIIILSGDGLVFEVLNGFIERHDATSIIPSLPIGIVPSGSGNGLLSSLFYSRGEPLKNPKFTERAIDVSCSPEAHAQPVNLIHVQTDREDIASFLSVGWGLMADIDIESERWRKLFGSNRFALGGLVRILNLRTYRGRLWYKPYSGSYGEVDVSYDVYAKTVSERMAYSSSVMNTEKDTVLSHRELSEAWSDMHTERVVDVNEEVPEDWTRVEDDFIGIYAVSSNFKFQELLLLSQFIIRHLLERREIVEHNCYPTLGNVVRKQQYASQMAQ